MCKEQCCHIAQQGQVICLSVISCFCSHLQDGWEGVSAFTALWDDGSAWTYLGLLVVHLLCMLELDMLEDIVLANKELLTQFTAPPVVQICESNRSQVALLSPSLTRQLKELLMHQ